MKILNKSKVFNNFKNNSENVSIQKYNSENVSIQKYNSENVSIQKYDFQRRHGAQTQDLQILKKFYMFQINPKELVHNTAYSA